jgi:peptidoglycan/LPS O-acetylase OafA/YrhL
LAEGGDRRIMDTLRLPELDGLRGMAILLVVLNHNWFMSFYAMPGWIEPFVRCGFTGVRLFFFLSGFVLLLPYAMAKAQNLPAPTWRKFISRRYLKIIPSYWLCILILQLTSYREGHRYSSINQSTLADLYTHLLFIHNFWESTEPHINGVMWSLGPEVQFYALFILLVVPFMRWPIVTTAILVVAANAYRIWLLNSNVSDVDFAAHQLPMFLDIFFGGMSTAYVYAMMKKPSISVASVMMISGICGFIWLIKSLYAAASNPGWDFGWSVYHQTALVLAFALTTIGALNAWKPLRFILGNPALVFLGAISYNLYLWHYPIAFALLWLNIPPFPAVFIDSGPQWQDLPQWKALYPIVSIGSSIAVATFLTYAFERPILRLKWQRS